VNSEVVQLLVEADFAIDGETVLPKNEYYVGDALLLKEKLEAKLSSLDNNILVPVFEKQLEVVKSKIVAPALEDIHPTPHMSWLPQDLIKSYLEVVTEQEVRRVPTKAYDLTRDSRGYIHVLHNDDSERHTRGIAFIARYLTGHGARRDEIDSYEMHNEGFVDWLNLEGHRTIVEQAYLEHAGVWLEPEYSSEPLDIKGWNPELVLRPWQLASARRALAQGRSIIALDVGLGKTYTAIAIALLAKQNAQCQVPVIAVPKSVIPNWRQEFYKAKDTAKLLVVGAEKLCDSSGRALLDGDGKEQWVDVTDAISLDRQLTLMRQDNWDAVLMTHTTLKRIKIRLLCRYAGYG